MRTENLHLRDNSKENEETRPELHQVLSKSISVLGSKNTFCSANVLTSKAFLAKLIKKEIKSEMFTLEQASVMCNTC